MPDKNNISMETKIVFTLKGFVGTIMSILTIFASFYFMVINPRIELAETNAEKLLNTKIENINVQLNDIKLLIERDHEDFKNGIKSALDASNANTHRFRDITDESVNSGSGSSN